MARSYDQRADSKDVGKDRLPKGLSFNSCTLRTFRSEICSMRTLVNTICVASQLLLGTMMWIQIKRFSTNA